MIHIILSPTTQLRSQAQLLTKRRGKYDLPFIVCKHPFRTSGRSVTWLLRSLSPKPLSSVLHRSWTRLAFTFVVDHRFRASHLRTIRQEICCITQLELWLVHQLNLRHESRWQSWLHESAVFLRNTSRPSSLSVAGSFGSAGMQSYSDQKEQGINQYWQLASVMPNYGNPGCLRKTGSYKCYVKQFRSQVIKWCKTLFIFASRH